MKKLALFILVLAIVAISCFAEPAATFEKYGLKNMLPTGKYTITESAESCDESSCDYTYDIEADTYGNLDKERTTYLNQIISSVLAKYPEATTYDDYYEQVQLTKRQNLNSYEYVTMMFGTDDGWEYTLSFVDFGWSKHDYYISFYGYNYETMYSDLDWDALMAELSAYDWSSWDTEDTGSDSDYEDFDWDSIDWGALFGDALMSDDYDWGSYDTDDDWGYTDFEDDGDDIDMFAYIFDMFTLDKADLIAAADEEGMDVVFNGDEISLVDRTEGSKITQKKDGSIVISMYDETYNLVKEWPKDFKMSKYLPKVGSDIETMYVIYNDRDFMVQFSEFVTIDQVRTLGKAFAEKFPIDANTTDEEMFGMALYEFNGYNSDGFKCEFMSMFGMTILAVGVPGESALVGDLLGE